MNFRNTFIFLWTFVVICVFVFFQAVREPSEFISSTFFSLNFDTYREWVWTVPEFFNTSSHYLMKYFDGAMTYALFFIIWFVGALIIHPSRELMGLHFSKGSITTLVNVLLALGLIGMLMIWYAGPWSWKPIEEWMPLSIILTLLSYQVIAGPIFEEVLFRGGLQGSIAQWIGRGGAAVFVSIFFAALHGLSGDISNSFPIFLGAAALGYLRWKTDSLYVCLVVHILGNGFLVSVSHFLVNV